MEKLHELHQRGPLRPARARHAAHPQRARLPRRARSGCPRFIDSRSLQLFTAPGSLGLKVLGRGTGVLFSVHEARDRHRPARGPVGVLPQLRRDGRRASASGRGRSTRCWRDSRTAFVLVTSPRGDSIDEAIFFHRRLDEAGMPFAGAVVNRVQPAVPARTRPTGRELERPAGRASWPEGASAPRTRSARLAERDRGGAGGGCASELAAQPMIEVPQLDERRARPGRPRPLDEHLFRASRGRRRCPRRAPRSLRGRRPSRRTRSRRRAGAGVARPRPGPATPAGRDRLELGVELPAPAGSGGASGSGSGSADGSAGRVSCAPPAEALLVGREGLGCGLQQDVVGHALEVRRRGSRRARRAGARGGGPPSRPRARAGTRTRSAPAGSRPRAHQEALQRQRQLDAALHRAPVALLGAERGQAQGEAGLGRPRWSRRAARAGRAGSRTAPRRRCGRAQPISKRASAQPDAPAGRGAEPSVRGSRGAPRSSSGAQGPRLAPRACRGPSSATRAPAALARSAPARRRRLTAPGAHRRSPVMSPLEALDSASRDRDLLARAARRARARRAERRRQPRPRATTASGGSVCTRPRRTSDRPPPRSTRSPPSRRRPAARPPRADARPGRACLDLRVDRARSAPRGSRSWWRPRTAARASPGARARPARRAGRSRAATAAAPAPSAAPARGTRAARAARASAAAMKAPVRAAGSGRATGRGRDPRRSRRTRARPRADLVGEEGGGLERELPQRVMKGAVAHAARIRRRAAAVLLEAQPIRRRRRPWRAAVRLRRGRRTVAHAEPLAAVAAHVLDQRQRAPRPSR